MSRVVPIKKYYWNLIELKDVTTINYFDCTKNWVIFKIMKNTIFLAVFILSFSVNAQENVKYQKPSKEILNLVEFERPPSVLYDEQKNYMVFIL